MCFLDAGGSQSVTAAATSTAFRYHVGIDYLEPSPLNALAVVDPGTSQDVSIVLVGDDLDALYLFHDVIRSRLVVKTHPVPVTAAAGAAAGRVDIDSEVSISHLLLVHDFH